MAVDSASVTVERTARFDELRNRQYTVVFRIRTTTHEDGPGTVVGYVLQRNVDIGTPYQEPNGFTDVGARCVSISPEPQDGDPKTWLVRCEFSSAPPERPATGERGRGFEPALGSAGDTGGRPRDPTLRPPEVRWTGDRVRKPYPKADRVGANGDVEEFNARVENTAGFPFNPLPERDFTNGVLTVGVNRLFFDLDQAFLYADAVNLDVFAGNPPGSVKCNFPDAELIWEQNFAYWRVTWRFEVRTRFPFWDAEVLNAGYQEYSEADADFLPIYLRDGQQTSEPWPLDIDGVALTPAEIRAGQAIYRRYRPYHWMPFAALGLGI